MKKKLVAGTVALTLAALVAGCGTTTNSTANQSTNSTNTTGSGVSSDMKVQFVSVTASAQAAIDDFTTGSSLLGPMDTKTIDGIDYSVVANSQQDLNNLEKSYLDFLTQAQVSNLFSHVAQKDGVYVYQAQKSSGDTNDWFKATVKSATAKDNGFEVTLTVPQTGGGSPVTQTALLVKDSSGHWVYAGA